MNNSSPSSATAQKVSCEPIRLVVRGIGPPPSFKNNKVIGRKRLFTNPKYRKWMDAAELGLESQLWCEFLTRGGVTSTGQQLLSWIASSLPEDDCCSIVSKLEVTVEYVAKGNEGADIEITPL